MALPSTTPKSSVARVLYRIGNLPTCSTSSSSQTKPTASGHALVLNALSAKGRALVLRMQHMLLDQTETGGASSSVSVVKAMHR